MKFSELIGKAQKVLSGESYKGLNGALDENGILELDVKSESYCQMLCTRNISLGGDFLVH